MFLLMMTALPGYKTQTQKQNIFALLLIGACIVTGVTYQNSVNAKYVDGFGQYLYVDTFAKFISLAMDQRLGHIKNFMKYG